MIAFIAACAGMFLFGITLITLGAVATDLKTKYQLSGLESGVVFSILPLGILLGSLIFGPVCDRYGYKLLLIIACVAVFAGFEGIAYSHSYTLLKISIFIFGVGGGVLNGATNAVVSDITTEHKGANLSLLGVFFGLGALGMPLVLGALRHIPSFEIVAAIGWLTIAVALFYGFVAFPAAKQPRGKGDLKYKSLFKLLLLLISFFLFFQSSFEAIINNWTTIYLTTRGVVSESNALFALSLHIVGMVTMRLFSGSILRKVSDVKILWSCLAMLFAGIAFMQLGQSYEMIIAGLVLSGAGLAEGFPLMLGITGRYFSDLSGTAFSFVFTVALLGNMLINYLMGWIVDQYGINHLTTVAYIEIAFMAIIFYFIVQKLKPSENYVSKTMAH